jgi:hypothetical protein
LRAAISAARQVSVPEPSPLFWDHFSARVRHGVSAFEGGDGPRRAWSLFPGTVLGRFACVTLALALVGAAAWRIESARRAHPVAPSRAAAGAARGEVERAAHSSEAAADEVPWTLVTDAAANFDLDVATGAPGMSLQPGAAERAALQLSADEQRELVRLLHAAIEQPE